MEKFAQYRKSGVAVVGFAATVAVQAFAPDTWQWQLANGVLAALTTAGVWAVPNRPQQ